MKFVDNLTIADLKFFKPNSEFIIDCDTCDSDAYIALKGDDKYIMLCEGCAVKIYDELLKYIDQVEPNKAE